MSAVMNFDSARIRKVLEAEKSVLVYHADADGMCSAALVLRKFQKPQKFDVIPREGPAIDDTFIDELAFDKPKSILSLDLPVDQEWKKMKKLKQELKHAEIVVIDHHVPDKNLNPLGILHINPMFAQDIYIPTSNLVYGILQKLYGGMEEHVWIAAMGIIADYGFRECKKTLEACKKLYPRLLEKEPPESRLAEGGELLEAAITVRGVKAANRVLSMLAKASGYEEFAKSAQLRKWKETVDAEVARLMKDFSKEKEEHKPNLVIYELKTKLNITSTISNALAKKYPNKIIIVAKRQPDFMNISMRHGSAGVSMRNLAKLASKGIGSGGGHPTAAGAAITDWEKFRKRVLKLLAS